MKPSLIYLYAIAADAIVFPEGTALIGDDGLQAVVSWVDESEFGEEALKKNLSHLAWVEKTVRRHEAVMEMVMEQGAIVPFRFPTLFYSESSLRAFLQSNREELNALLKKLTGKEEWGLKIYASADRMKTALAESSEIKILDSEIATATVGKAYLLKKKRDALMQDAVSVVLSDTLTQIFESLQNHSVESKLNATLSKSVTERDDEMLLNAAFLVDVSNREQWHREAENWKLISHGLLLEASGPWAAYNFCYFKSNG
jgi:hypothetical protein